MSKYSAGVLTALPLAGAEWEALQLAERAALLTGRDASAPWVPYPHQIPPSDDDWDLWLMLGGRGAGKTDALAAYIDQHVRGPACLPGLAGGHRLAIVAPTHGDAVEACVNGPSGIRAHNPAVRLVTAQGGTFVRWPGGAEARIFGAYTPEDVERLRAGGNRCVAGDTLVRTTEGRRPISELAVGDTVLTRNGTRRVLRAGMTQPSARLWRLETEQGELFATADHEVLTVRGWLPLRLLRPGDTLATWQQPAWSTSSSTTTFDSTKCETATTIRAGAACCTGTSGSMRSDRSRLDGISITDFELIRRRRMSPVSNVCLRCNTSMSTRAPTTGIVTVAEHPGQRVRTLVSCASNAATHSRLGAPADSAPTAAAIAPTWSAGPPGHTRTECARCAASRSRPSREARPGHAHVTVRRCSPTDRVEPVYDLMVEHDHEFFAADIVVSNCMAWCEELAAWAKLEQCWDHLTFGLRLGAHPRAVASTTPKPKKLLRELIRDGRTRISRATTDDNPALSEGYRRRLERYRGTRLGRQEIGGELLEDVPGALWTYDMMARAEAPADLVRVVVAVDPSGGADPENDEQGIIVAGTAPDARGYVLADRTCRLSPDGWGRRAVQAYVDFKADAIVGEANYGGDMVEAVIRTAARAMGVVGVSYKAVHASRGKAVRAQPVAALYEQGRVSHCDVFADLEEELTSWTTESGQSPNRLDGLVWAISDLMVKDQREVYVY